ncbi:MAG: thrombospondin type 3 repeat-containing protein [bacterium]
MFEKQRHGFSNHWKLVLVLCSFLLLHLSPFSFAATLHVWTNSPENGPGTAWSNAFHTIQAAVDAAVSNDAVLVTNGVYDAGGAVTPGYALTNRVCIAKAITVESVNGREVTSIVGASDNGTNGPAAVRCVYLEGSATLIGFTLTNGHTLAGGSYGYETAGGGAFILTNGVISSCTLSGNSAVGDGGGAFCYTGGEVNNCTLSGNTAARGGGAACYFGGLFANCTLTENTGSGGACFFYGGGTFNNCTMTDNRSPYDGGGAYCYMGGALNNCVLSGNSALRDGGGTYSYFGGIFNNCALSGNTASNRGGGGYVMYCGATFDNCTMVGNSAMNDGGGVYCDRGGWIHNTIIWSNTAGFAGANWYTNGVDPSFDYCCTTPDPGGRGNITNDPWFVDAVATNFHLLYGSPCIDSGTNLSSIITNDLDGIARPLDGDGDGTNAFDMGCYEYRIPVTLFVSTNSPEDGPGTAWSNAFHTIQGAVDAAFDGDTVWVTNGVYDTGCMATPGRSLSNRVVVTNAIFISSVNGPAVTIIAGAPDPFTGGNGTNAVRCVFLGPGAELTGFTLTNGHTQAKGTYAYDLGGGGVVLAHGGTLSNCVISGNGAGYQGGGVYFRSNGLVVACTISGNSANDTGGGGFCFAGGSIVDCDINGNTATNLATGGNGYAGAVYVHEAGMVRDCRIGNNRALYGGGVFLSGEGIAEGCTIVSNNAADYGGGAVAWAGGLITNCTISRNSAGAWGGGVLLFDPGGLVTDCDVSDNSGPSYGGGLAVYLGGEVRNSTINSNRCTYAGGGVYCGWAAGAVISNCTLQANYAASRGGAFYCYLGGTVNNCTMITNTAMYCGGLYFANGGSANYCNFINNDGGYWGGGVVIQDGEATVNDCAFTSNSADYGGGAYLNRYGTLNRCTFVANYAEYQGGGVCLEKGGRVADSTMADNRADDEGGGVYFGEEGTASNCTIYGNGSVDGGGVFHYMGGRIVNSLIYSNSATDGGGVYSSPCHSTFDDGTGVVANCTITGNRADDEGGGVYCDSRGLIENCIVYHNAAATDPNWHNYSTGMIYAFCCTTPLPSGDGNIANTPCFVSPGAGDYHLEFCAAVDAGMELLSIPYDLDGVVRPFDGDLNGSNTYDMGCYEYAGNPHNDDTDGDGLSNYDEVLTHLTDPANGDTDNDGQNDYAEINIISTDPLDAGNCYTIGHSVFSVADGFVLSWVGHAGRTYTAWTRYDLRSGDWTNVTDYTDVPGIEGPMTYTNASGVDFGFIIISVEKP